MFEDHWKNILGRIRGLVHGSVNAEEPPMKTWAFEILQMEASQKSCKASHIFSGMTEKNKALPPLLSGSDA